MDYASPVWKNGDAIGVDRIPNQERSLDNLAGFAEPFGEQR
jgi:hypothetical protein